MQELPGLIDVSADLTDFVETAARIGGVAGHQKVVAIAARR
ncbi:hypothetical protein [Bradyrhizobium sp. YR681]|nr:hypothetical protein [Bradyrhizobium sp. YR681]